MVIDEKEALRAVHRLLIQGRTLAYENAYSNQVWAWFFDEMDYLMGMVVTWEDKDMSKRFEMQLEIVCAKVNASHIFEEFKR
ncbi:MAG: hypothetical protein ACRYFR_17715 [Janthinobacterium lividum]